MYTHEQSSIIHNRQKADVTQVSTDREWVTIVYTYNGVVSSLKKEGNSDTGYNKAKP